MVVMGGFDPPPRVFQARALPTELHDHGAGPGTRTRINWFTKPAPILLGPAGTSGCVTSRRVVRMRSFVGVHDAQPLDGRSGVGGTTLKSVEPPVASALSSPTTSFSQIVPHRCISFLQVVREEGVEPSSQGPKPCVLPLDDSRVDDGGVNGYRPHYSWVEATRVSVNTLTPMEQ